jgi:hypothetical protein
MKWDLPQRREPVVFIDPGEIVEDRSREFLVRIAARAARFLGKIVRH